MSATSRFRRPLAAAILCAVLSLFAPPPTRATPILSDNFDADDTNNFDTSDQTGRRAGLLADEVQLRSSMIQHGILNGQLRFAILPPPGGEARVRFHDATNLNNWWNWAAGAGGLAFIRDGGMRVEFDWTPDDNDSVDWVAFSIGFPNGGGEPAGRVNNAGTDFGIRFRNNGETEFFDNSTPEFGGSFDVTTVATHHVTLEYAFTSFADGTSVSVTVAVDGVPVVTDRVFDWAGNNGTLAMELGNLAAGTLIDNFSISTLGIPQPDVDLDGLPDSWEQAKAGNRTDLTGLLSGTGPGAGTGNFDGDTFTDLEEFQINSTTWPDLNPKAADSDGDSLDDGAEIDGFAPRPPTNPTNPDTDGDGLNDTIETNRGTFASSGDPGTNPSSTDSDGDHFSDPYEIQKGTDPTVTSSIPTALPAGFTYVVVTDEASTGISATETYTHKISGGGAVTINGVDLDALTTSEGPVDFTWETSTTKNHLAPTNNGTWIPAAGNVTGSGNLALFGSFTYSGGGSLPGSTQQFILSGLQPDQTNELRLFIRKWDNGTVRPTSLKFTNGAEVNEIVVLEDRPGTMLGNGNDNSAYFINYRYIAGAAELILDVTVPNVPSANGSFHMYGLTNRIVPLPGDADSDGLADSWEQEKAGNLTDLTGLKSGPGPGANTGNFDADSLTDDQEYSFGQVTFPALNPKLADTDSDGLEDGSEITPTAPRVATNPTIADTDGDGLSDGVESNTGIFVDQDNAGSNPLSLDTDNDQFPDAYEVRGRSNPSDAGELPPVPAGFVLGIVTDEVSTGISPDLIYTHKISGGGTATVNEVTMDNLNTTETPENFEWDPGTSRKLIVATPTNNNWNPAGGDVTGAGNLRFFGGFTYAGDAATAGGKQTFTLSGLEPGKNHEFRLYIRKWANDTVRPSLLRFTNGTSIDEFQILEDRPGIVTGTGNDNTAYYISYSYVTQGTDLVMEAIIPNVSSANGSFHMFGLTNRQTDPIVPPPVITSFVRAANGGSVTLTIATQPGRTYAVDYSTLLTPSTQPGGWVQITNTLTSQGAQTEFVDTQFSTLPGAYYRVRDVTP